MKTSSSKNTLEQELADARATIAQQADEIAQLRAELDAGRNSAAPVLNQEARAVAARPELLDVRDFPPPAGARLFALGRGGVLVPTVWSRSSKEFFGAWMPYPKIPASVREWLSTSWIDPQPRRKEDTPAE